MGIIIFLLLLLLAGAGLLAGVWVDYEWWKELGQSSTWWEQWTYGTIPMLAAGLLASAILWVALARGLKQSGKGMGSIPGLVRFSALGALLVGFFLASSTIDSWTIIRFFGGRSDAGAAVDWRDPVFLKPLGFYLFELPFYLALFRYLLVLALLASAIYWLSGRIGEMGSQLSEGSFDVSTLQLSTLTESLFLRTMGAVFLVALGVRIALGRYGLLTNDHGFMVGIDYVDETIRLPLLWGLVGACLAAALLVAMKKWYGVLLVVLAQILQAAVPGIVSFAYVRPNEIGIQRPYIERHIQATRQAFGLTKRVSETEFAARMEARIEPASHAALIENVRLWDWRAFHDTVTQIQALRPYYVFADSDVDRYMIDGKLRQVMLTPRELDIRQLPDARTRWINPHFIYTHGYGMVMAEASRITADGMPSLLVQDAPAKVRTTSLKLTRPEIYFGEVMHEPVFVRTGQTEFSYPSGNDSVFTRYEGRGGIPVNSLALRVAAAIRYGDPNILLTNLLTSESRLMMRRKVADRVRELAPFLEWDHDPYLVLTDDGRLVWTLDGYTLSDSHPYSRVARILGRNANYMRNSVKATIDAYHGTVHLYVFDEEDPIVKAYRNLFPKLFEAASAMPADLRRHARYPEVIFRVQAEVYRAYHMRDPQAFYNKEDLWDMARAVQGKETRPQSLDPTYVVATLPGESKPEFLLLVPFTPRNKDNLIGLMIARCDGENLGELRFLQMSKQALLFGPMQIEARIDQDPEIAKDLSLWSQKGSEVLRGQMIVLPVGDALMYVEPIYIQAAEARMPQLQKVVVAAGNDLIYRNTYEEAIAALSGRTASRPETGAPAQPAVAGSAPAPAPQEVDRRVAEIRNRLRRYRELWSQGKYSEAGRELEAVEAMVR